MHVVDISCAGAQSVQTFESSIEKHLPIGVWYLLLYLQLFFNPSLGGIWVASSWVLNCTQGFLWGQQLFVFLGGFLGMRLCHIDYVTLTQTATLSQGSVVVVCCFSTFGHLSFNP